MLVILAAEAGAVKEGSGFLPSRRVLGRAIKACAIERGIETGAIKAGAVKASSGSYHQSRCG